MSAPSTMASVIRASAYSFCASCRNPANSTSGWSRTASSPSLMASAASAISSCARPVSRRWIARIAFAHDRMARRAAGRARSRAAIFSSNRRWKSRWKSSKATGIRWSAGGGLELPGRPHHDVDFLGVDHGETVVRRTRGVSPADRHVSFVHPVTRPLLLKGGAGG